MIGLTEETWRAVPGWEEVAEVSSWGRVRTLDRSFIATPGYRVSYKARNLRLYADKLGYRHVALTWRGVARKFPVHRLVAMAFIPNPDNHPWVLHSDDRPENSHAANLRWGTALDNSRDRDSRGRNAESNVTHCPRGHPYEDQGYQAPDRNHRSCMACGRLRKQMQREVGLTDPKDSRHGTLGGYTNWGCRCPECVSAMSEYDTKRRG